MTDAAGADVRPVFFIGMPRSGTTITFAAFATHRDLAWFSQYMDRFPWLPGIALATRLVSLLPSTRKGVARHGEGRSLRSRLQISFSEAYGVWERCCGESFVDGYLLGIDADPGAARCMRQRVRRTMSLQGKPRFAAKLTGPGRIHYLTSIFPEARFVHVIRDPRAVVDSLLRVPFWRDTHRLSEPAWNGGLTAAETSAWKRRGTAEALAAVQWGAVLRTSRAEADSLPDDRYMELRYEDFIAEPHATLERLHRFARLDPDPSAHEFVDSRLAVRDLSADWHRRLSADQVGAIEALLAGPLGELGYAPAAELADPP